VKIQTTRAALLPALAACAEVANPRGTSPVYAAVLLTATADGLRLRSTNGFQALGHDVSDVTVDKPGVAMVRADTLRDVVRDATGDGMITLTDTGRALLVEQKTPRKVRRAINTHDPKTAPMAARLPDSGHSVNAKALAALLGRVAPMALAHGTDRQNIQGVYLEARGDQLVALALDSLRMARSSIPYVGGPIAVTVPLVAVNDLRKLLAKRDGSISIALVGNAFYAWGSGWSYSTQLHDGAFPVQMETLIPPRRGPMMRVARASLLAAVASAATAKGDDRLRMRSTDSSLVLRKLSTDGPHEEEIDAEGAIGSVATPDAWIRDALDMHGGAEWIEFYYDASAGPTAPLAIRAEGSEDVALVIPLAADEHDRAAHAEAA
jgi:DNA polymerase-3 subunit beta